MRTTLDLDEDVLLAAKEIASRDKVSLGKVISRLLRGAITRVPVAASRNGFPIFTPKDHSSIITLELVNQLRDEGI